MHKHTRHFILPALAFLAFACMVLYSCDKEEGSFLDMGYDYLPMEVGATYIYKVDSISWDDFHTPVKVDTKRYQVKKVVEETMVHALYDKAYRVERFVKMHDTLPWRIHKTYVVAPLKTRVLRLWGNQETIQLVFPVRLGKSWDANAYNSGEPVEYRYESVGEPKIVSDKTYDSTLEVLQEEFQSLITDNLRYEVYAKHTGLIYRKDRRKELDINSGEVTKGYDYTMKLIDYVP